MKIFRWVNTKDIPQPLLMKVPTEKGMTIFRYYNNDNNKFIERVCNWTKANGVEKYNLLINELPRRKMLDDDGAIEIIEYDKVVPVLELILEEISENRQKQYEAKFNEWIELGKRMRAELGFAYPEFVGFADDYKIKILREEEMKSRR